jgi:hypothetical protein
MTSPFPFVASQVLTAQQLNDIQNLPISDKTASYTLIAGDETKRTMMNNASATTITVNNSIFTVGDVIQVANKGAGACTLVAGVGVTINTSGSLALAQYGGGYLLALSASTFTFFNLGSGASYGVATGGTSASITVSGTAYTLLTFTSDDNLVVSKAGLFDVYMVGAGGGGGFATTTGNGGGGGGAGGLLVGTVYLTAATYPVDIGAGGAGGTGSVDMGRTGFGSSIGSATNGLQIGGGGGAAGYLQTSSVGANGAGGAGGNSDVGSSASTPLGFAGGNGSAGSGNSGGGGGHTAVGGASGASGGISGAGQSPSTFTGGNFATTIGVGGTGAGPTGVTGSAGGANTGNGGNGSFSITVTRSGGAGGSGRVFVRFKV